MRIPLVKAGICGLIYSFWLSGIQGFPKQSASETAVDPAAITRVTLGGTSGTPGTSVVVPIYFTPAIGLDVGRLNLDIRFVSASLKFLKVDRGLAAELGGVDLSSKINTEKNEEGIDITTLTITFSSLLQESPLKGIPAGLLGYVAMKIDERGRPAAISLRTSAEANELGSMRPVQNLKSLSATVEVVAPGSQPMVTCFFFSH